MLNRATSRPASTSSGTRSVLAGPSVATIFARRPVGIPAFARSCRSAGAYGARVDLGLSGRTYVVSGASRGLGFAVASALHAEGASVVLAARDPGPLEDAADRLGDGRAFPVAVDLADPSAGDLLAD